MLQQLNLRVKLAAHRKITQIEDFFAFVWDFKIIIRTDLWPHSKSNTTTPTLLIHIWINIYTVRGPCNHHFPFPFCNKLHIFLCLFCVRVWYFVEITNHLITSAKSIEKYFLCVFKEQATTNNRKKLVFVFLQFSFPSHHWPFIKQLKVKYHYRKVD